MAKKNIPRDQINKRNKDTLKKLKMLMEDLDQKFSIRVGIIGDKAQEIHEETNLTNAQLGAIHEFGSTITVTDKIKGWFYYNAEIHKSNNPVVIPTRSFLRMPLLSTEGKREIIKAVLNDESLAGYKEYLEAHTKNQSKKNADYRKAIADIIKNLPDADTLMEAIAIKTGIVAQDRVFQAFDSSGFGNWAPISEFTKERRKKDKSSPPLTDTSQLRNSITYEVKKIN